MLAGALLFAFVRRPGTKREHITGRQWLSALIIGACLLLAGNGIVTWGEQYVGSGLVALIVATVPLWMALFAPLFGGFRVRWTAALGIAIGLAGVSLLLRPGGAAPTEWQTYVVPASPLLWALGSLYAQRAPMPRQALTATAMEMLAGGALLFLVGLAAGELGHLHLAAITPGGSNTWSLDFEDPSTGGDVQLDNVKIATNTLVIYIGANSSVAGSELAHGGPGGWSASGSQAWLDAPASSATICA